MKVKERKNQKGITLIALVITIIILLILAGVTLSIVFNGGIIDKSQTAVDNYDESAVKEKITLHLIEYKFIQASGDKTKTLTSFFTEKKNQNEITAILEDIDEYIVIEVDGYYMSIDKQTLEITKVNRDIIIRMEYPDGTALISTAKVIVTVENGNKNVDASSLKYGWSNSKTTAPTSWTSFASGATVTKEIVGSEKLYLWVKANYVGGNSSTEITQISSEFYADTVVPTVSLNKEGDVSGATSVKIIATATSGELGIKTVKYLKGEKNIEDFENGGIVLTENVNKLYEFNVDLNGIYTVYIEGNNGKKSIQTIQVENIKMLYLFNEGDECSDITGGWNGFFEDGNANLGRATIEDNVMKIENWAGAGSVSYAFISNNEMDLSEYSTMYIECEMKNDIFYYAGGGIVIGDWSGGKYAFFNETTNNYEFSGVKEFSLDDVSKNKSSYQVLLAAYNGGNFIIKNIWIK